MAHTDAIMKIYEDEKSRDNYIHKTMPRIATMFRRLAKDDVKAVMRNIGCLCADRRTIRVLSLGCGPGSDLLGLLRAVNSALRKQDADDDCWKKRRLQCRCIGVDAFAWNWDEFNERVKSLEFCRCLTNIRCRFVCEDMENFVRDSTTDNGLIKKEFDFICLSFSDADRNLWLIGTALPRLLSEFGRILVLDNDIPLVRSLTKFGFTCNFVGDGVCMHSRGRLQSTGFYQASVSSPMMQSKLRQAIEHWVRLHSQKGRTNLENELQRLRIDQSGVYMPERLHCVWKEASIKEELRYYESESLQRHYIQREMQDKASAFRWMTTEHVREVLKNIECRAERTDIHILSLGCGPGSDLMGILNAIETIGFLQNRTPHTVHCTGVDAFEWNRSVLERRVQQLCRGRNRKHRRIECRFFCEDIESFVHDSSATGGLIAEEFDFICLSFADAGRNLFFIGSILPHLLTEFGRILVLDRDIPRVRNLRQFGYELEARDNYCLLSRGQATQPLRMPFRPSPCSAIILYRLHLEATQLMQQLRLKIRKL